MTNNRTGDAPLRTQDWLITARQELAEALARPPTGQFFCADLPPKEEIARQTGLEAQLLLAHTLGKPRAWAIAHPETLLSREQQEELNHLLVQRISGVPLPYLLGHWEFFGLDFEVTPDVLIPRPETELLAERAIDFTHKHPGCHAADVGTGSGCIAISLLQANPRLRMTGVDISWQALQVARRNAVRHAVLERLALIQGDLLSSITGALDLVCANLPYIPHPSLQDLEVARHEPITALDGGSDGLEIVRRLVMDAPRWLAPGGQLLLEMQYDQGPAILEIVRQHLPQAQAEVLTDLAGKPRLVEVNNPLQ